MPLIDFSKLTYSTGNSIFYCATQRTHWVPTVEEYNLASQRKFDEIKDPNSRRWLQEAHRLALEADNCEMCEASIKENGFICDSHYHDYIHCSHNTCAICNHIRYVAVSKSDQAKELGYK